MAQGDTFVNALIGAVATTILSGAVPFAPVAGGVLAGYLEGGSRDDGVVVGAISGGIALVPVVLIGFFLTNVVFFAVGGPMGMPGAVGGLGIAVIVFGLFFGLVYVVGLSAFGGWLGNYIRHDTDIGS